VELRACMRSRQPSCAATYIQSYPLHVGGKTFVWRQILVVSEWHIVLCIRSRQTSFPQTACSTSATPSRTRCALNEHLTPSATSGNPTIAIHPGSLPWRRRQCVNISHTSIHPVTPAVHKQRILGAICGDCNWDLRRMEMDNGDNRVIRTFGQQCHARIRDTALRCS